MNWLSKNIARIGTRDALDTAYPALLACDSPNCSLAAAGGKLTYKSVAYACGADEDANVDNIFQVTGAIRVLQLYGLVTDVTNVADFEAFTLEGYDGANSVDLCAASELDGITIDTLLLKDEDGDVLTEIDGGQVRYSEVTTRQRVFTEGILLQKTATATYIRSIYNGSNVDAAITWIVRWQPMTPTSKLVVV